MAHRLIFVNNDPANLNGKYVVGSGAGGRDRSVQRALRRRASNNAQGDPCCFEFTIIIININKIATPVYPLTRPIVYNLNADYTIQPNHQLNINSFILQMNGHTLTNEGILMISDTGIFRIDNYFVNNGILVNSNDPGTINITAEGTFMNLSDFTNESSVTNLGLFNNTNTGSVYNTGTITNENVLYNDSVINNQGIIANTPLGTITNDGHIYYFPGSTFTNTGMMDGTTPYVEIDIMNIATQTGYNSYTLLPNVAIYTDYELDMSGVILTIPSGVELNNSGTIFIKANSIIKNQGILQNNGLLKNYGHIYYLPGSVFIGSGTFSSDSTIKKEEIIIPYIATQTGLTSYTLLDGVSIPSGNTLDISGIVLTIPQSTTFVNNGKTTIQSNSIINNRGTITTDSGTLTNYGHVYYFPGSSFSGSFSNASTIKYVEIIIPNIALNTSSNKYALLPGVSIPSGNALDISGVVLDISSGLVLTNQGTINNKINSTVNNKGTIANNGLFNNYGNVNYFPGSFITGTDLSGNPEAVLIANISNLNVATSTYNLLPNVIIPLGSTLTLPDNKLFNIQDTNLLINNGIITNNNTLINNEGTINNQGTINHFGNTFNNSGVINNAINAIAFYTVGTFNNTYSGIINNYSYIDNTNSSNTFTNYGTITNYAFLRNIDIFTNQGTINNKGNIRQDGLFTNYGHIYYFPNSIISTNYGLTISGNPLDVLIQNVAALDIGGNYDLSANVVVPVGSTFTIPDNQRLLIKSGITLVSNGIITTLPTATINNNGVITNQTGAAVNNKGTINTLSGTFTNIGHIYYFLGSTFTGSISGSRQYIEALVSNIATLTGGINYSLLSSATIPSNCILDISGVVLDISAGLVLTNQGTITNKANGNVNNKGTINTSGTFNNSGHIYYFLGSTFTGSITGSRQYIEALVPNIATFTSGINYFLLSTTTIPSNCILDISGVVLDISAGLVLTNQGIITNEANAIVNNKGTIMNNTTFTNDGHIYYFLDSSFNGTISGSRQYIEALVPNIATFTSGINYYLLSSATIPSNCILDISGVALDISAGLVLTNQGTITNEINAIVNNKGTINTLSGTFNNNGHIYYFLGSTFTGTISGSRQYIEALVSNIATFTGGIHYSLLSSATIPSNCILDISGVVLDISSGLTLTNQGTITNKATAAVNNKGTINTLSGTFLNDGHIYYFIDSSFNGSISGSRQYIEALVPNIATFTGGIHYSLLSSAAIPSNCILDISGVVLDISAGLVLTNQGTITNEATAVINNKGTINTTSGTFNNNGHIYYFLGSTFTGTISGSRQYIEALVSNIATLTGGINYSLIQNTTISVGCVLDISGVVLDISGGLSLINYGTITNELNATLNNRGTLTNSGTLMTNYGTLNNLPLCTFTNNSNFINDGTVNNQGAITTFGSLTNNGHIYYFPGSTFTGAISGSTTYLEALMSNIATNTGVNAYTLVQNISIPTNCSFLITYSITLNVPGGLILTNNSNIAIGYSAQAFIYANAVLNNYGTFIWNCITSYSFGTINNQGIMNITGGTQVINQTDAVINNYGTITASNFFNYGHIYYFPASTFTGSIAGPNPFIEYLISNIATNTGGNNYTMQNNVIVSLDCSLNISGVVLDISGGYTLTNNGYVINEVDSVINNKGTITNNATFLNNGHIYYFPGSIINGTKDISGNPVEILLSDIATNTGGNNYTLQNNTTISLGVSLDISGVILNLGNKAITNHGTINNINGSTIICGSGETIINDGGTFNNLSSSSINSNEASPEQRCIFTNKNGGTINNNGSSFIYLVNMTIDNSATINNSGGTIYGIGNNHNTIYNSGILLNANGLITAVTGIYNYSIIYNYNSGTMTNDTILNINYGVIYNGNPTTLACGTPGTINVQYYFGNPYLNECPPP